MRFRNQRFKKKKLKRLDMTFTLKDLKNGMMESWARFSSKLKCSKMMFRKWLKSLKERFSSLKAKLYFLISSSKMT
jgi:hypothetical protein